jgi:hypothetical protein
MDTSRISSDKNIRLVTGLLLLSVVLLPEAVSIRINGSGTVDITENMSVELLEACKILRFHGGDYEECRLLGYKTSVPTS